MAAPLGFQKSPNLPVTNSPGGQGALLSPVSPTPGWWPSEPQPAALGFVPSGGGGVSGETEAGFFYQAGLKDLWEDWGWFSTGKNEAEWAGKGGAASREVAKPLSPLACLSK